MISMLAGWLARLSVVILAVVASNIVVHDLVVEDDCHNSQVESSAIIGYLESVSKSSPIVEERVEPASKEEVLLIRKQ